MICCTFSEMASTAQFAALRSEYEKANAERGEVIRVRINRHNDLSPIEDADGFHVRKSIVGRNCFRRIEAELTFDKGYRQVGAELSGATVATREDWEACSLFGLNAELDASNGLLRE